MRLFGHESPLPCCVGLHDYSPDIEAGYPYQECVRCGKLGIFRPRRTPRFDGIPLRR